jgi:hypothetical protein
MEAKDWPGAASVAHSTAETKNKATANENKIFGSRFIESRLTPF